MSWKSVPLGDLYAEPSRNGVYKSKEHHGAGAKIVNMGELFAYDTINGQDMKRLRMSDAEMQKSGLAEGDLLFGRRSLVESGAGKCSIVEGLTEPTTFESSIIRVRVDRSRVRPRFLFYWLKSPNGRGRIRAIVTGTNVKGIRGSVLKTVDVVCPPLQSQDYIVSVLRAYDDLIENNRRRIQLLEQAARQLYKEWFVHLRFPGHEHVKITDSVPEDWEKVTYSDVFEFLGGFAFKSKTYQPEGKFGIVTIKNVHDAHFIPECSAWLDDFPEKMKPHCVLATGDVLLSLTGNVGRACIVFGDDYLLNQRVAKVLGKPEIPRSFVYWTFSNDATQKELENLAYGVAQLNLSPVKLGERDFARPSSKLLMLFAELTNPMFDQICTLNMQNAELAKAHDLLLPRLMNGEIPV